MTIPAKAKAPWCGYGGSTHVPTAFGLHGAKGAYMSTGRLVGFQHETEGDRTVGAVVQCSSTLVAALRSSLSPRPFASKPLLGLSTRRHSTY